MKTFRKNEVVIEATAGGEKIETTIAFTDHLNPREMANIKVAFESGLREGLLLAERVVRNTGT